MVDIAQLVEHRFVVPSVVGSIPIIHPKGLVPKWSRGLSAKELFVGSNPTKTSSINYNTNLSRSSSYKQTL